MHRINPAWQAAALLACAGVLPGAACDSASGTVVVEVLPPRTSVTCSAPSRGDPALGKGLLDVAGTVNAHGHYLADLRLSSKGQDARVTGVSVAYDVPEGASEAVKEAAEEAAGEQVVGAVLLAGEGDDLRQAVLENVELVPRALSLAIADDDELGIDAVEFARLSVMITPIVDGLEAADSSFAIDLCRGCLVQPPVACAGDGEHARNTVCRPGQDAPLFRCVEGGAP